MAENFECKIADGFSSTTLCPALLAALMTSGCASNAVQQNTEVPKPAPPAIPAVQTIEDHIPKAQEIFPAACQATGSFKLSSNDDLLMQIVCARQSIPGQMPDIFQVEDMEIKKASEGDRAISLKRLFENETCVFVERTRDQVVVTLNFQAEDGSYYIKLTPQENEYSFTGFVSDMVEPKVHWRLAEQ